VLKVVPFKDFKELFQIKAQKPKEVIKISKERKEELLLMLAQKRQKLE